MRRPGKCRWRAGRLATALGIALAVTDEHGGRGGGGGHLATVEGDRLAVLRVDQHEAPATDAAVVAHRHAEREGGGDGGVDRVAAVLQYVHAGRRWRSRCCWRRCRAARSPSSATAIGPMATASNNGHLIGEATAGENRMNHHVVTRLMADTKRPVHGNRAIPLHRDIRHGKLRRDSVPGSKLGNHEKITKETRRRTVHSYLRLFGAFRGSV